MELHSTLLDLEQLGQRPKVTAYNRIDGPGSSLDLREFQQSFWSFVKGPAPDDDEAFAAWSRGLPRTIGITIDTGIAVEAHPLESGKIGVRSQDFDVDHTAIVGQVPFRREFWLLRIMDAFGLDGVRFELRNLVAGTKSSGLGGSATATTAVCLLANALAEADFTADQLVGMASLLEQDMGVSITGTQEQANVVYGGVTDYLWFPWGKPGSPSGYGTSVRRSLLAEDVYPELERRLRIYHSGRERASTDVNAVWCQRLSDHEGLRLHRGKLDLAWEFREGIRTTDWDRVADAIRRYANIRVRLCPDYRTAECWEIQHLSEAHGAESFPLGAGGGGAVLVFARSPERLLALDEALSQSYRQIGFRLRPSGHVLENLPTGSCPSV